MCIFIPSVIFTKQKYTYSVKVFWHHKVKCKVIVKMLYYRKDLLVHLQFKLWRNDWYTLLNLLQRLGSNDSLREPSLPIIPKVRYTSYGETVFHKLDCDGEFIYDILTPWNIIELMEQSHHKQGRMKTTVTLRLYGGSLWLPRTWAVKPSVSNSCPWLNNHTQGR